MNSGKATLAAITGALALAAVVAVSGAPQAAAQGKGLALLARLTKGEWTIKHRDGSPDRKICVRSGQELIQLRHREGGCSQFVIEDAEAKVAVQYTCPNNGFGRTSIRKETAGLVQLESQGIEGGLPFQLTAEARHTGPC